MRNSGENNNKICDVGGVACECSMEPCARIWSPARSSSSSSVGSAARCDLEEGVRHPTLLEQNASVSRCDPTLLCCYSPRRCRVLCTCWGAVGVLCRELGDEQWLEVSMAGTSSSADHPIEALASLLPTLLYNAKLDLPLDFVAGCLAIGPEVAPMSANQPTRWGTARRAHAVQQLGLRANRTLMQATTFGWLTWRTGCV